MDRDADKTLLERYMNAAANLYGIIPLSKLLSIYNSQNPPMTEAYFLELVDNICETHHFFSVAGKEEFYKDAEKAAPIDRDLIAEHLLMYPEEEGGYYPVKEEQVGKPYYVPDKAQLLKYEDEEYMEKTPAFISLRAFFRNLPGLTRERADEVAGEMRFSPNIDLGDTDGVLHTLSFFRISLDEAQLRSFLSLYADFFNHSRLHIHRGHTPADMGRLFRGR